MDTGANTTKIINNNSINQGANAGIVTENAILRYQQSALKEEIACLREENAEWSRSEIRDPQKN